MGGPTSFESGFGRADIGVLAREIFFVPSYAFIARIVPVEVMVLRGYSLVLKIDPSFLGFFSSLGAVHP